MELPSVLGAFVREDVNGRPREIHLLVRSGPNPRHLAYDVRDLLEQRLGMPIDQRVISIAQLAPGRQPGPLLGGSDQVERDPPRPAPGSVAQPQDPAPVVDAPASTRLAFHGIATDAIQNRIRVRVSLDRDGEMFVGEASGVDSEPARLRAAATATLSAVDRSCVGRARFEAEHISVTRAFERDYVVVSVLISSPFLGRRPLAVVGAQPVELDVESAATFAALKAVNRIVALVLNLEAASGPGPRDRLRGRRS